MCDSWLCPAVEKEIDIGLCYEYCYIDCGCPLDTARELKDWIKQSEKYKSTEEFIAKCNKCNHYSCNR